MTSAQTYLSGFHTILPTFQSTQENTLEWLVMAHVKAQSRQSSSTTFQDEIREKIYHVGCKPGLISHRGHVLPDFQHTDWKSMLVYNLERFPEGEGLHVRNSIYSQTVAEIFQQFYLQEINAPSDLIHVSCTGYDSPSGAQKIVSSKGWGSTTTITHAYHMGCYAALPAIRMASGFIRSSRANRTDIVHTELCSLHFNPARHEASQLVVHSLFADGFIKYSVYENKPPDKKSLKICSYLEQVIPDSADLMKWGLDSFGFSFILAKEIPVYISRALNPFLKSLCVLADEDLNHLIKHAIFAIHPGGPKILKYFQKQIECADHQIAISYDILKNYGNMSSCMLPHMWSSICANNDIPIGTKIISLAFGPGLTIAGIILEKTQ